MQLVEIDVVGLQPPQAALEGEANLLRADVHAVVQVFVTLAGDLGGENHVAAATAVA